MEPRRWALASDDPHIHVERRAAHGHGAVRNMLASEFGLVPGSPAAVETGCGLVVPYAMTSGQPERVTCLACRDHAYREHLRFARTMEAAAALPGSVVPGLDVNDEGVLAEARRHRDLADRYARPGD